MKINDSIEDRFGAVAGAFERNFAECGEVGAAVGVYLGGRPVVDLWAGLADRDAGRAWQRDTMVMTNSTTKGFTATVAHVLVERGLLKLDAPVASYWPEFAANGKQDIPVRWVLSHRAGVPALDQVPHIEGHRGVNACGGGCGSSKAHLSAGVRARLPTPKPSSGRR